MANMQDIRQGMQVLGSDGGMIGTVEGVEGNQVAVVSAGDQGAPHHHVPSSWVERVDDHVHLNRTAALARDSWVRHGEGAPAGQVRTGREAATDPPARGSKWLWILGLVFLLIIVVLGIWGFGYAASEPDYENSAQGSVESPDT